MIRSIILPGLRVHVNRSREIYYSFDSRQENNKSHSNTVQYVLTLKTYKLEVSTSMVKTNHINWYVMVFINETPNFITDYELKLWVYKELVIYIFCD